MAWVDGKEHRLPWSYKTLPLWVFAEAINTINDRPFLGVAEGRLKLDRYDCEAARYGGWTVVFTFMECAPNETVAVLVKADDDATPFALMLYGKSDFRKMFVEPRVGLWARIVNWFKLAG